MVARSQGDPVYSTQDNAMLDLISRRLIEMAYIEVTHSYKRYEMGDTTIVANKDINFTVNKGGTGRDSRRVRCRQVDNAEYSWRHGYQ
jgi:hypothetical protein